MQKAFAAIIIVLAVVGGVSIWRVRQQTAPFVELAPDQVQIALGTGSVAADIADTETLREKGLSGRQSLSDTQGMLFIFQEEGIHSFWMKDMLIPLDMIWL